MDKAQSLKKNLDVLDLAKFVLSFLVVAIHTDGLPIAVYPWLRIAVPLFFVISSFLLFGGIQDQDQQSQKRAVGRYVKRNLILYAVWFVLLLPFTYVARRSWFNDGIWLGILRFVRGIFLGSTFRASWFITASVLAVLLVYFMSKRIPRIVLAIGTALFYVVCCLMTSYRALIVDTPFSILLSISKNVFDGIATSFVHALFWVVLGKLFAEHRVHLKRGKAMIGSCLFAILLYMEHFVVTRYLQASPSSSCFVSLIPLTLCLFAWLIGLDAVQIPCAKRMRHVSTLIYVSHCAVLFCVSMVINRLVGGSYGVLVYVCTCLLVTAMGFALVCLSEKGKWSFLKKLW